MPESWKEYDVSHLPAPSGYEQGGILFASRRAAELYELMKDLQWHTKTEVRVHLQREEDRAALRDLRQSGFEIERRASGQKGVNEWRLASLIQNPAQIRIRSAITKKMEENIFERDGYRCVLCGATGEHVRLVVDHRIPIDRLSDRSYIRKPGWSQFVQTLCKPCNDGKRQECAYCKIGPGQYRKNCEDCHLAYPERYTFVSARVSRALREQVLQVAEVANMTTDQVVASTLQEGLKQLLRKFAKD